jgi:hypothetical protein
MQFRDIGAHARPTTGGSRGPACPESPPRGVPPRGAGPVSGSAHDGRRPVDEALPAEGRRPLTPGATSSPSEGRPERRHDLRWQLAAALAIVVTGMSFTLWWAPVVKLSAVWWRPGPGAAGKWIVPGDIWVTMRAAHVVAWGGEGILYQNAHGFITFPAIAVVLAPVAMLCSALHLSESFPLPLAHPTAWLLVGPVEMAIGSSVLFALGAVARRLGVPRRRRVALVWLEAAVVWPAVAMWGHPEDLVALAVALYALVALLDRRCLRAAGLFGAALAFQPLVLLMLPVAFACTPVRRWLTASAAMILPAAALLAAPLLWTWHTTTHNLVDQPTFPTTMHATPWVRLSPVLRRAQAFWAKAPSRTPRGSPVKVLEHVGEVVAGGPSRIFAVVCAVLIGWYVARRRPPAPTIVCLVALALCLRCVFEAVMIGYYVIPGLALTLVVCAAIGNVRLAMGAVCAAACTYLSYMHASPWGYYIPVTTALLVSWLLSRHRSPAAHVTSLVPRRLLAARSCGPPELVTLAGGNQVVPGWSDNGVFDAMAEASRHHARS